MNTQELVRIIEYRMQTLGMGWMELEEKSGVRWCTVRGWRTGKHGAMLDTAARVLDALGLELVVRENAKGRAGQP